MVEKIVEEDVFCSKPNTVIAASEHECTKTAILIFYRDFQKATQ